MKKQKLSTVVGGYRWELYCSLCGGPFEHLWQPAPEWLKKITLLIKHPNERVEPIPGALLDPSDDITSVDYYAWRSFQQPPHQTAIPLHRNCFQIVMAVLRHQRSVQAQEDRDAISLERIYMIFMERAEETFARKGLNCIRIFEPTDYGNIHESAANIGYWSSQSYFERDFWWYADPKQLLMDPYRKSCPNPGWMSSIPVEIAKIIFDYAYGKLGPMNIKCDYVFPQMWWCEVYQSTYTSEKVKFDETQMRDWEWLVRELSASNDDHYSADFAAFLNRHRIWNLASTMRQGDTIDLRTRYCSCMKYGWSCQIWDQKGTKWCRISWENVRQENGYPEDWKPSLLPYDSL